MLLSIYSTTLPDSLTIFLQQSAISNKAAKAIRRTSRGWSWPKRSDKSLEDLARMFNPIIQGWINYYSRYYKSALYPILKCLERRLVIWATRKYKHLRHHKRRAAQRLNRIARKQPNLFAHWKMLYGNGWTIGAG